MKLNDLNLRDIDACVTVSHLLSVRESARFLGLEPSQVSKMIGRVERELGQQLFHRSQQGMRVTSFGHQVFPGFKELLAAATDLSVAIDSDQQSKPLMNIGSLSFLNQELMTRLLNEFEELPPQRRYRLIDVAPDQIVSLGLAGAFEAAMHVGKLEWTGIWTSKLVGQMRWCLYAAKGHPLPANASEAQTLQYPFVIPAYWAPGGFSQGNDHCPVPLARRIKGTETSTAVTAVNVIAHTNEIAFLPEIVAAGRVEEGQLKHIKVSNWPEYRVPVYLTVRNDLVTRKCLPGDCSLLAPYFSG